MIFVSPVFMLILKLYYLGDAITVKNGKFAWGDNIITLNKYVKLFYTVFQTNCQARQAR